MKRMIKLALVAVVSLMFIGCAGPITGYEYTKDDFVIMYKVVRGGVTTFMTPEQIEKAKLDKANMVVTKTYKLVEAKNVATE